LAIRGHQCELDWTAPAEIAQGGQFSASENPVPKPDKSFLMISRLKPSDSPNSFYQSRDSPEVQKASIASSLGAGAERWKGLGDVAGRVREPMEPDRQQVEWADLCRQADASLQRKDFAETDRMLAAALAISTDEQMITIKAMQDRCRWTRVLAGVDTRKKRPILFTFVGTGAKFFGERDYDPGTRSYVTFHWFTLLFVPILPLGAYRVTDADVQSYYIHGKVPLTSILRKARWAIAASVMVLALVAIAIRGMSFRMPVSTTTSADVPQALAPAAQEPAAVPAVVQRSASNEIEEEEKALSVLAQSIEDRQKELQAESMDMAKQKGYLAGVASSYAGERVPGDAQALYDALFNVYTSRVKHYEQKRAALKADVAGYQQRVSALNARIQAFNKLPGGPS